MTGPRAASTGTMARPATPGRDAQRPGLVPPRPPDDDEKHLYIQRNLPYLTTVILIGSIWLVLSLISV